MLDLLGPHNSFFLQKQILKAQFNDTISYVNSSPSCVEVLPNFDIIYFHCKSVNSPSTSASFEFSKINLQPLLFQDFVENHWNV